MPMAPMLDRCLMTVIGTFAVAFTCALAEPDPCLRVETRGDGISFDLMGAGGSGIWLLQHSPDARGWEDLVFLDGVGEGRAQPGIEIQWGALPDSEARQGFFRAVQTSEEDPLLRRFLTERTKWRLSGFHNYRYELRQNFGQISWHGIAVVVDDAVDSFETIDLQPPVVDVPEVPTIVGLFDRVARAIAVKAATIDVTWHPIYGFPESCFIDLDPLLADEERGWAVDDFIPAP
jgi:hypothetical protein